MTADGATWIGAEATVEGRPLLVRSRNPHQLVPDPRLPTLLVIELRYPVDHETQLPSEADYRRISDFELKTFDSAASADDLKLVYVETGSGVVRYYSYTSDANMRIDSIDESSGLSDALTFFVADDPQWHEFRDRASRMR